MSRPAGNLDDLVNQIKTKMPKPKAKKVSAEVEQVGPREKTPYELCHFWQVKYEQKFPGMRKRDAQPLGKHLKLMGHLKAEFPQEKMLKMIGWFIHNCQSLPKYQGAPTIEGLWAWRDTVILAMEGKLKATEGRKDSAHKRNSEKDDGVVRL
jgi:hypothetical protein